MAQRGRAITALVTLTFAGLPATRVQAGTTIRGGASSRMKVAYARLPLSFEANRGQADRAVHFLSRVGGGTLSLTANTAVLSWSAPRGARRVPRAWDGPRGATRHTTHSPAPAHAELQMKLLGANAAPRVAGLEALPGKVHYLRGRDPRRWVRDVPTYAKVRYTDVYRGVDLVYYGSQRQLEYDFVVRPGADPRRIRLGFTGAQRLRVAPSGDLIAQTAAGEARWRRPLIYQEVNGARRQIPGRYILLPLPRPNTQCPRPNAQRLRPKAQPPSPAEVGFQIAAYDPRRPLVIDPVLLLSATYLGGTGDDAGVGIAVDATGSAYVTGDTTAAGRRDRDAFVTKLNPTGSAIVYTAVFGGQGNDSGFAIAVDTLGRAAVTGVTDSPNFPTTPGAFQRDTDGEGGDAFVLKLNAAGSTFDYSTLFTFFGDDAGTSLALDAAGNAYVTGTAFPGDFFDEDAFVAKFNPTGSKLLYALALSDEADDEGFGIAVDAAGNAYVTGASQNPDFLDFDVFVAKVDPAGSSILYALLLGGFDDDYGRSIALDGAGNVLVAGSTASTNFFPLSNALQSTLRGGVDAFVCKLNRVGTAFLYSTLLGGSGLDFAESIAADAAGNAYVTGSTNSSNFPTANPWPGSARGAFDDAFVTKLDATGSRLIFSGYLGGNDDDEGFGIAVDAAGGAYVTGLTFSTNFPRARPVKESLSGSADALVAKIGDGTAPATGFGVAPGANANGWNNTNVTVTLNALDEADGSGVKEIVYTLSGAQTAAATVAGSSVPVTITAEGATRLTYFARDLAGNEEAPKTLTLRIDKTPPLITALPSPAARLNGWNNSDVTVSFTCSDALSGVAVCPVPTLLSGEGIMQSATGTAIDMAGNVASATVNGIRIDKTPPIITFTGGGEYTVDQQVNITCAATEAPAEFPSGLAFSSCQNVSGPAYTFGLGPHELVSIASDRAGNLGTGSTIFTVKVTFTSLCNLTGQFASNASVAASLCASLTAAEAAAGRGDRAAKAAALAAYTSAVTAESDKSLTAARAAILVSLAGGL